MAVSYYTVNNPEGACEIGDPVFLDDSHYELAGTLSNGNAHLTWTVPNFPVLVRGGLWLQRSITAMDRPVKLPPLEIAFSGFVLTNTTQPPPDANWTTVASWNTLAYLSTYPMEFTDTIPAGSLFATYRLIAFTAGPTDASYLEVDWNVISVTRKFVLTGVVNGTTSLFDLSWTGTPQDALFSSFIIEQGETDGTWTLVQTLAANIRSYSGLPSGTYRVRGVLSNGLYVDHNPVSSTPVVPTAQIQRMFGGKSGMTGAGVAMTKIVVDSQGNVIVAGVMLYTVNAGSGELSVFAGQDAIIAKYSPLGVCLWAKHYGGVSNDKFYGLCVDSSDNIYAIGSVLGSQNAAVLDFGFGDVQAHGGGDVLLLKLSSAGTVLWSKVFGGSGSDTGRAITIDPSGDVYITGTHGFFGTGADFGAGALAVPGRPSAFLVKLLGSDGSHVWSKSYGNGLNETYGVDVTFASDGTVILGARFVTNSSFDGVNVITSGGGSDVAIVKCNSTTGATVWVKQITGPSDITVEGICEANGIVYAVGDYTQTATVDGHSLTSNGSSFLYVFSFTLSSGAWANGASFGSLPNAVSPPHVAGVAALGNNGIVITGTMLDAIDFGQGYMLGQGASSAFLVRLNTNLASVWSRRGRSQNGDSSSAIAVLNGGVYFAGGGLITGFERISGFGQVTVDPATSIVTTSGTDNLTWWIRFTS